MALQPAKTNTINVYILNIQKLEGEYDRLCLVIPPFYVQKISKVKSENAKKQELAAGYLLYKYLGVKSDDDLTFNEYGKPMLSSKEKHFSISHSGKYVVLAVSYSEVGVDIERKERITLKVLKRVLPKDKYEKLEARDFSEEYLFHEGEHIKCEDESAVFASKWTGVEAVLKAMGMGFRFDLQKDDKFLDDYHIESFEVGDEYIVSCASKEEFRLDIL